MNNQPPAHQSSERGIALVVVLLMMAVLSGLVTGLAMNGNVEVQMATNEVHHAGARAAAEAGLNRAIVEVVAINDNVTDLLAGADGAFDENDDAAAVNEDNGQLDGYLGAPGPHALGSSGDYTFDVEILDDDDPDLYPELTSSEMTALAAAASEDDNAYTDTNNKLILRATGYGPKDTIVHLSRVIEITVSTQESQEEHTALSNPAILVDGDLTISGNISLLGDQGNVHANGDMTLNGNAADVEGDATASGTFTHNQNWEAGGEMGGGRPTINVPNVSAAEYEGLADYKISANSGGQIQIFARTGSAWSTTALCTSKCSAYGWTGSGSTFSVAGSAVTAGTYYVEGNVSISGNPGKKGGAIALSLISTGSITISGTPKFTPENESKIQFVTDQDLVISGNVDLDDPTSVEGQILVREQMVISGNPEFQGRIIVKNQTSTSGSAASSNTISGNPTITYNGTLGEIETVWYEDTSTQTKTYNVTGWMER